MGPYWPTSHTKLTMITLKLAPKFQGGQFSPLLVQQFSKYPQPIQVEHQYQLALEADYHLQQLWLIMARSYHKCPTPLNHEKLVAIMNRRSLLNCHISDYKASLES